MGTTTPLLISIFICFFLSCLIFKLGFSDSSQLVPAVYIFGDSLMDVGNNNHLTFSIAKADFPHYGIDFLNSSHTGRFSNGKISADYLAEKVGLATSPPYLSVSNGNYTAGVNFASGGASIINRTNSRLKQSIDLIQQVDYYLAVYDELVRELGSSAAQTRVSKSLFVVEIGSNDMFGYFESSDLQKKSTPQEFVDLMSLTLETHLKRLYNNGARKLVMIGTGVIGCIPAMRYKNKSDECNEEMNYWSDQYNQRLKSILDNLKQEFDDINYSYFDTYLVMLNYIDQPSSYGFAEVKAACCGIGRLKARLPCLPVASYCSNRNEHLFWDQYHPTQEAYRIFSDFLFDGLLTYTYPINVRQLVAL